jgi:hypothetical protein
MTKNYSLFSIPRYSDLIYYFAFAFMFTAKASGLDEGNIVYSIVFIGTMSLFLLKIASTEHTLGEYFCIGLLLALALIVYHNTGEKGLLLCFTMMLGMKDVRIKNVFQIGAIVLGVFLSLNVFLSVFGLKGELFYYQERVGMGGDFRHALGYPHPNSLQLNCFILVMLIMFLIGKKSQRRVLLASCIMMGISLYIFLYSGSRTGLLITVFYLFVNYYMLFRSKFTKMEKAVIQLVYPVCAGVCILVPFAGSQKMIDWISEHMDTIGSRVRVARYYFDLVRVSLFGSRIEITKDFAYGIDMGYAYLFLVLGVAAFVIFAVLYIGFIHYCLKKDHRSELAVTLSIVLMGVLEPFLFNLSFKNLSLIFLGQYIFTVSEHIQNRNKGKAAFLSRRLQVFKWGSQTIPPNGSVGILMEKCRNWNKGLFGLIYDSARIKRGIILYIASVTLVSVVFNCTVKKPSAVYTDSDKGERTEIGLAAVNLSEPEAAELRKSGDILIHYQGPDVPMYRYEGTAADNEYVRRMISSAVWCGLGTVIVYNIIITFRKKKSPTSK